MLKVVKEVLDQILPVLLGWKVFPSIAAAWVAGCFSFAAIVYLVPEMSNEVKLTLDWVFSLSLAGFWIVVPFLVISVSGVCAGLQGCRT